MREAAAAAEATVVDIPHFADLLISKRKCMNFQQCIIISNRAWWLSGWGVGFVQAKGQTFYSRLVCHRITTPDKLFTKHYNLTLVKRR